MRTTQKPHLGESVGFAAVLALMSLGIIALMLFESKVF